jgi:hypothetical protein
MARRRATAIREAPQQSMGRRGGNVTQTAILSVATLILGAFIQYFFTRYLEQQRQRREIRTRAYIDYMNSVSDHSNLRYGRETKEWQAIQARTADAKCRICRNLQEHIRIATQARERTNRLLQFG